MSNATPVSAQYMADHYGNTLEEYRADPLAPLLRRLNAGSEPHGIFRNPFGDEVVYSLKMGEMMGYERVR